MKSPKSAKAVESGIVRSYHPWGFEVELEESGNIGLVGLGAASEVMIYRNQEYWPEPGERVRVACLGVWPDGKLRMTMREFFIGMLEGPHFQHLAPHGEN